MFASVALVGYTALNRRKKKDDEYEEVTAHRNPHRNPQRQQGTSSDDTSPRPEQGSDRQDDATERSTFIREYLAQHNIPIHDVEILDWDTLVNSRPTEKRQLATVSEGRVSNSSSSVGWVPNPSAFSNSDRPSPSSAAATRPTSPQRHEYRAASLTTSDSSDDSRFSKAPFVAKLWLIIFLVLGGIFAWRGCTPSHESNVAITPASSSRTFIKDIEDVKLLERTAGNNPQSWDVEVISEPDPETSREIHFEMTKPSGKRLWMQFVWSLEDIETAGAMEVGATVEFDMAEMGAAGPAKVTYIGPCPPITAGSGNLVTGLFKHEPDGPLVSILIEGASEPIVCTGNHPIWSEDRGDYVEAGELSSGENVWSAFQGVLPVVSVTPAPQFKYVYNLQIHGQHVYEVSELGVLVHNKCHSVLIGEGMDRLELAAQKIEARLLTINTSKWTSGKNAQWMGRIASNVKNRRGAIQRILDLGPEACCTSSPYSSRRGA